MLGALNHQASGDYRAFHEVRRALPSVNGLLGEAAKTQKSSIPRINYLRYTDEATKEDFDLRKTASDDQAEAQKKWSSGIKRSKKDDLLFGRGSSHFNKQVE